MAGTFVSPSGAPPKMKHGKPNRPKRTADVAPNPFNDNAHDPHRFGSDKIPNFHERRACTNNKSGWNTIPGQPIAGRRLVCKAPQMLNDTYGKVVARREEEETASNQEYNKEYYKAETDFSRGEKKKKHNPY